jgi:hypothetical protein
MTESEFLNELTRRTDCLLLLDVTNIFNNAANHGYDAAEFIKQLPGDRVRQMHLAGGFFEDGTWFDSHSEEVQPEVWDLFDLALKHTAADIAILERDSNFQPWERVMKDIDIASEIFYRNRPSTPPELTVDRNAYVAPPELPQRDHTNLRDYQRATIRRVSDESFRARVTRDPMVAMQEYAMNGEWHQRWRDVDAKSIRQQVSKFSYNQKRAQDEAANYKRFEMHMWNAQNAGAQAW